MRKLKITKKLAEEMCWCSVYKQYEGVVITDNQEENFKLFRKLGGKVVSCYCGDPSCTYGGRAYDTSYLDRARNLIYDLSYGVLELYDDEYYIAGELADAVGVYFERKKKQRRNKK